LVKNLSGSIGKNILGYQSAQSEPTDGTPSDVQRVVPEKEAR
jgi:hypothetical protein